MIGHEIVEWPDTLIFGEYVLITQDSPGRFRWNEYMPQDDGRMLIVGKVATSEAGRRSDWEKHGITVAVKTREGMNLQEALKEQVWKGSFGPVGIMDEGAIYDPDNRHKGSFIPKRLKLRKEFSEWEICKTCGQRVQDGPMTLMKRTLREGGFRLNWELEAWVNIDKKAHISWAFLERYDPQPCIDDPPLADGSWRFYCAEEYSGGRQKSAH